MMQKKAPIVVNHEHVNYASVQSSNQNSVRNLKGQRPQSKHRRITSTGAMSGFAVSMGGTMVGSPVNK